MKKKTKKPIAVDLFCGAGGMTYGLIKAGLTVSRGIDIDPTCRYAYEENNKVPFLEKDIRSFSTNQLKKLYPSNSIKILIGCAPCQPFSTHTHKIKNRKDDEKWGLLYSFSSLIRQLKPEIVSMENVAQITRHEVFDDFVNDKEFFKGVYDDKWSVENKDIHTVNVE